MTRFVFLSFRSWCFLLGSWLVASCNSEFNESPENKLFTSLSPDKTNIQFSNTLSPNNQLNIIEYLYYYNGGGVAIADFNNDSLPDIYFTANQSENKLYLNKGDFVFEDITTAAGVAGKGDWANGVTVADVNGDGLLDIYVCYVSGYKGLRGRNELYINNGDLTFTESAAAYGLDFVGFGTQAVFLDYDLDGDLDVYLLNHSVHDVGTYGRSNLRFNQDQRSGDKLMQNQLAQGATHFIEVTQEAGIYASKIGYGLGIAASDINQDGYPDLYVSNDFHENDYLYINQGDGTFKEQLETIIGHTSRYSMGNDIGDINHDGLFDIVTTDMLPKEPSILMKSGGEDKIEVHDIKLEFGYGQQLARNAIQLNRGNGHFSDIALFSKMFATDWSWSPLIADFDNDGWHDIHFTNGIVKRPNDMDYIQYISNLSDFRYTTSNQDSITQEMIKRMPTLKIPNEVFQYKGDWQWESVSSSWGLSEPSYSSGAAYADLDNDGDLDLVINNINQPAFVFKNNTSEKLKNNYVKITLQGVGFNTNAIGATVKLTTGGKQILRYLTTTRGFQSAVEPNLTIGLGKAQRIDSLEIHWPSGKYQLITDVQINTHLWLKEPPNSQPKQNRIDVQNLLLSNLNIDFKHEENTQYKDHNAEYLLPQRFSTEGPAFEIGDINNDGLDDIFVGGAMGQPGVVFFQNKQGNFDKTNQESLKQDQVFEDVAALLADVDNDKDLDLIVLSAGYQFPNGYPLLSDRLYLNTKGQFEKAIPLAGTRQNSSSVAAADFDQDGDIDIFIGFIQEKGHYGTNADGVLLVNDGSGNFKPLDNDILKKLGVLKSAIWADYDGDGDLDLIVAGHWMPITILENNGGQLTNKIEIPQSSGLWNTITAKDIDLDGDVDIVAGNAGLNNKFMASPSQPLKLYVADFDNNGTSDPILMHYQENRYVPVFTKDELVKQVVSIKKRYTNYQDYANSVKSIHDLFDQNSIDKSIQKSVEMLESSVFVNEGNKKFKVLPLPAAMQFSTINSFILEDLNSDSLPDIISAGNFYQMHVNLGRQDADFGSLAFNNGDGSFRYIQNSQSGLAIKGQVEGSGILNVNGQKHFMFVLNNDSIKAYKANFKD